MRRRLLGQRGQTTTEFVMIAGLTLVVATGFLAVMNPTVRQTLQQATECVISDVCTESEMPPRAPLPAMFPGSNGASSGNPTVPLPIALPWVPGGPSPSGTASDMCHAPFPGSESECAANAQITCEDPGLGGVLDQDAMGRYQDCKALKKRLDCSCGINCDQCDGYVSNSPDGKVVCVNNSTDGGWGDVEECDGMIHDVTRMMNGDPPLIKENDSIRQMKKQILDALKDPSQISIELIGHSQGSIVLSEALWQLQLEDKGNHQIDWSRLHVAVMGHAELRFPPELEEVHGYANHNGVGDWVAAIGEIRYPSLVGGENVATVIPDSADFPCAGPVSCHSAEGYLKWYEQFEKTVTPPSRTIMVNGILTNNDSWKANCTQYDDCRYMDKCSN